MHLLHTDDNIVKMITQICKND